MNDFVGHSINWTIASINVIIVGRTYQTGSLGKQLPSKQLPIENGVVIQFILRYSARRCEEEFIYAARALYLSEEAGQPNEKYEKTREGGQRLHNEVRRSLSCPHQK
jgi:hypothetical protein